MATNFSIQTIKANEDRIKLVDSDNNLSLYCYETCDNTDTDFIKQCRGLVYAGETLLVKTFPYADEYNNEDDLKGVLADFSSWSFFNSYEGALLRVFYCGKWYISTNRKLDAFRSKWSSSESFGDMFVKALEKETRRNPEFLSSIMENNVLERFLLTLDQNKQYVFLVRNNKENRIVCDVSTERDADVYHIGTYVDGVLVDDNVGIEKPVKLELKDLNDLLNHIQLLSEKDYQGVVGFGPENKQVKIMTKKYQQYFKARGNERSIKFRYLQVRQNPEMVEMLRDLYPTVVSAFEEEFSRIMADVAVQIHRGYISRFIHKQHAVVPPEMYHVTKQCHGWHIENRQVNIVTLAKVNEILLNQPANTLNHILKKYRERAQTVA